MAVWLVHVDILHVQMSVCCPCYDSKLYLHSRVAVAGKFLENFFPFLGTQVCGDESDGEGDGSPRWNVWN